MHASETITLDAIPAALRAYDQWVVGRFEQRNGKQTKVPYNVHTGRMASVTEPTDWASFDKVKAALERGNWDFAGFVLTDNVQITVTDQDSCIGADGISPEARQITDKLNSYTEISISGTGLHNFVRARLPPGGRRKGKIEMYDASRYIVVTGRHLPGTPPTIEDRQSEIEQLHREIFGTAQTTASGPNQPRAMLLRADQEIIEAAAHARNGAKFGRLWRGDIGGYGSQSEADLALLAMLAFWTHDAGQLDRLFRQSGLYRPKWERANYREPTIAQALSGGRQMYSGMWRPPEDLETIEQDDARARERDPLPWLRAQKVLERVPLVGARKLGTKRGEIELILEDGHTIELGTAGDVLAPLKVQAAIADALPGVVPPEMRRAQWRPVAEAIMALAGKGEDIGTDPESEAKAWLAEFTAGYDRMDPRATIALHGESDRLALALRMMTAKPVTYDANAHDKAFFWTTDGNLVVHVPSLVRFVTIQYGQRTSQSDTIKRLRRLDFEHRQLSAGYKDEHNATKIAKARVWLSPQIFDPND